MPNWTILCDFDGTISVEDITDTLLVRFARSGWEEIEQAWKRGEIGSRECMAQQIALLDVSRAELDAHLDQMSIDRDFAAFATAVEEAGLPMTVLSDGLDYSIRRILGRNGLARLPVAANHLIASGERSWRLEFPYANVDCRSGNCKCASSAIAHGERQRVLVIGDGASDFCVAGSADFVFAKHRLVEHCRAAGIAHLRIDGFADALALLPRLLAGELDALHAAPTPLPSLRVA
ncbi:HAD-IB family phosphatase [Dokdonella sp.]|uniref:HAD-IB family phosphatase n=1 Tax=Dokdonella sp. TaxID=2291710 RepID=UPI0025C4ABB1|nr:HAD-IB family phosphatase [Dokdonella sp.]MBX3688789.1 HAD-IB family phosphatase [Dokdonella sp.]